MAAPMRATPVSAPVGAPAPVRATPVRIVPRRIYTAPAPPEVIAPAPAVTDVPVPVPPRVVGISPPRVVPRIVGAPAEVPRRVESCRSVRGAPRAEHRGYVLGLHPHFVTRDHDVVECRVVCRGEGVCAAVTQVVIARGHAVRERGEAAQTARIGALVGVGHETLGLVVLEDYDMRNCRVRLTRCILFLGGVGLSLGQHGLPFGFAGLGLGLTGFGFSLLLVCDGHPVVRSVEVVETAALGTVVGSGTSCCGGSRKDQCQ